MKKLVLLVVVAVLLAWGASWIDYALDRYTTLLPPEVERDARALRACLAGDATLAELEDRWHALAVESEVGEPAWEGWPERCALARDELRWQLVELEQHRSDELSRVHLELKEALLDLTTELNHGLPAFGPVKRAVRLLDALAPAPAAPSARATLADTPPLGADVPPRLAPVLPGGRVGGLEQVGAGVHIIDRGGTRVCAIDATSAACWYLADGVPRRDLAGVHVAWSAAFDQPAVAVTRADAERSYLGVYGVRDGAKHMEVALADAEHPRGAALLDDGSAAVLVDGDPAWVAREAPGAEAERTELPDHDQLSMLGPWIAWSDDGRWSIVPWAEPSARPHVLRDAVDPHGCTTPGPTGLRTYLQTGPSSLAVHDPAQGWSTVTHDFDGAHEVTCSGGEAFIGHVTEGALWFHRCDASRCVGAASGDHGLPASALPDVRGAPFGERVVMVHEATRRHRVDVATGVAGTRWDAPWRPLFSSGADPMDGPPGVIFSDGFALVLLPLAGGTAAFRVMPSGETKPIVPEETVGAAPGP